MKKTIPLALGLTLMLTATACKTKQNTEVADAKRVENQQEQYAKYQPVPFFDFSTERGIVIALYKARNNSLATHAVWRSNTGMIEGDCASKGYSIPYDTSLTNPWTGKDFGKQAYHYIGVGQAEPNGTFQGTNSNATWVTCVGEGGAIEPVSVESKVTTYPYSVKVDYTNNRVTRDGPSSVKIKLKKNTN